MPVFAHNEKYTGAILLLLTGFVPIHHIINNVTNVLFLKTHIIFVRLRSHSRTKNCKNKIYILLPML